RPGSPRSAAGSCWDAAERSPASTAPSSTSPAPPSRPGTPSPPPAAAWSRPSPSSCTSGRRRPAASSAGLSRCARPPARAPRCSSSPSPTDPRTAVPDRSHDPEVTMTDAYTRFIRTAPGGTLAKQLGLPRPARLLRREDRPEPVLGPVVVLGDSAGADRTARLLLGEGADVRRRFEELRRVGSVIVVLDELTSPADIGPIVLPLAGAMRSLAPGARVVTISRPAGVEDPARAAARGGVEGFVRSLAHEMRGGGTANGVTVEDGVPLEAPGVIGALRFLLSARSAFITGQFLHVSSAAGSET